MEFWVAVGTGVLALATFVLAGISAWNVKKTGALVSATESLATNAKATIEEIQQDRELAHRPYISWNAGISRQGQTISDGRAYPTNFGRGPVVHGLCCYAWNTPAGAAAVLNLMTTDLFDLSADADAKVGVPMMPRSGMMADADVAGNKITESGVKVAFCRDQLGNYYRFVPYETPDIFRPRPGVERPKWTAFYADQFVRLSKP